MFIGQKAASLSALPAKVRRLAHIRCVGMLTTLDTFYVLRFSREAYVEALNAGQVEDDGVEAAFEVVTDIQESVRTGQWIGDAFIYTNTTNRLNYLVGDQIQTISHFDQPMYIVSSKATAA